MKSDSSERVRPNCLRLRRGEVAAAIAEGSASLLLASSVYVMGVSDALIAVKPNLFCVPPGITVDQERAVVVKYLRDHPETWHYSASSEVGVALKKAFPCKEQAR